MKRTGSGGGSIRSNNASIHSRNSVTLSRAAESQIDPRYMSTHPNGRASTLHDSLNDEVNLNVKQTRILDLMNQGTLKMLYTLMPTYTHHVYYHDNEQEDFITTFPSHSMT